MQRPQAALRGSSVLFVLPPCLPTPPIGYGGIEIVAASLLPALEAAGAKVTLATPNGSTIQVTEKHELTEPLYPILSHPYNMVAPRMETYTAKVMALAHSGNYDVIHDFSGMLPILNTLAAPLRDWSYPAVIHTIHGPLKEHEATCSELLKQHSRLTLTAISHAQIAEAPPLIRRRTRVIYNGLSPTDFSVGPGGHRLLVLGRLCEDKGQDRLVRYCAKAGYELDVAGTVAQLSTVEEIEAHVAQGEASPIALKPDFQFYKSFRQLMQSPAITFHGNVAGALKHRLLGHSRALVIPNRWAEPFGMVAIEAMASGTPVIAMGTGALRELIVHGVTGYLADTFEELCEYLQPKYTAQIDRNSCRRHIERKFSIHQLTRQWLHLYEEVARRPTMIRARSITLPEVARGHFIGKTKRLGF